MMCWPSGVTATANLAELVCPLKVWTSVPSTWYSLTSSSPNAKADHKVHAVGQRRDADPVAW